MTTSIKPTRSKLLKRIKHKLMICSLLILVFILRRKLKLNFLSVPDPVLLSGNLLAIRWEVKGCYKIVINKSITIPGSTHSIWLNSDTLPEELTLQFFGKGPTIQKTVILPEPRIIHLKEIQLRKLIELGKPKKLPRHFRITYLSFAKHLASPLFLSINTPASIVLKPLSIPSLTLQIPNYEKTVL